MNLASAAWRAVFEDSLTESGRGLGPLISRLRPDAHTYANANVSDGANADAHTYANADAHTYADADAYADAYAHTYAYALQELHLQPTGRHMTPGLYLYTLPSGSSVVIRVGWVRRVEGDEYESLHTVTPYRSSYSVKLTDVALQGPTAATDWTWSEVLPLPVPINRFHCVPIAQLDPAQWSKVCPMPEGWKP